MARRLAVRELNNSLLSGGATDHVDLGDLALVENGADFSIELWFRKAADSTFSVIFAEGTAADWADNLFILYAPTSNTGQKFRVRSTGTGSISTLNSTNTFNDKEWHHLVYCNGSSDHRLYVDGVEEITNTTAFDSFATDSAWLLAGNNAGTPTQQTYGEITGVRMYSSALTATEAQELYYSGKAHSSLIHKYTFSEGSGATLTDSVGSSNGTITAATWSTSVPMKARTAISEARTAITQARMADRNFPYSLNFDGTGDEVSFGNEAELQAGAFTIAGWFNSRDNTRGIFTKGVARGSQAIKAWEIAGTGSALRFALSSGAAITATADVDYPSLNDWHFVVASFDGTTDADGAKIRVDNGTDGTDTASDGTVATNKSVSIGGESGVYMFDGRATQFRMWNRVLTDDEKSALYTDNAVPQTGLVLEALCTEGSGSSVADTSGEGNTGTITNATWSSDSPFKSRTAL